MQHNMDTMYLYQSHLAFKKVDSSIYQIMKDKSGMHVKGSYVSSDYVIQVLNTIEKVGIFSKSEILIHANFSLEEE